MCGWARRCLRSLWPASSGVPPQGAPVPGWGKRDDPARGRAGRGGEGAASAASAADYVRPAGADVSAVDLGLVGAASGATGPAASALLALERFAELPLHVVLVRGGCRRLGLVGGRFGGRGGRSGLLLLVGHASRVAR